MKKEPAMRCPKIVKRVLFGAMLLSLAATTVKAITSEQREFLARVPNVSKVAAALAWSLLDVNNGNSNPRKMIKAIGEYAKFFKENIQGDEKNQKTLETFPAGYPPAYGFTTYKNAFTNLLEESMGMLFLLTASLNCLYKENKGKYYNREVWGNAEKQKEDKEIVGEAFSVCLTFLRKQHNFTGSQNNSERSLVQDLFMVIVHNLEKLSSDSPEEQRTIATTVYEEFHRCFLRCGATRQALSSLRGWVWRANGDRVLVPIPFDTTSRLHYGDEARATKTDGKIIRVVVAGVVVDRKVSVRLRARKKSNPTTSMFKIDISRLQPVVNLYACGERVYYNAKKIHFHHTGKQQNGCLKKTFHTRYGQVHVQKYNERGTLHRDFTEGMIVTVLQSQGPDVTKGMIEGDSARITKIHTGRDKGYVTVEKWDRSTSKKVGKRTFKIKKQYLNQKNTMTYSTNEIFLGHRLSAIGGNIKTLFRKCFKKSKSPKAADEKDEKKVSCGSRFI